MKAQPILQKCKSNKFLKLEVGERFIFWVVAFMLGLVIVAQIILCTKILSFIRLF